MSASTAIIFDIIGRDNASDKFNKVGRSADGASGKMSKLGSAAKTAAKVGVFAVAAGAAVAGKALFEMAQGAAEDAAGAQKLATALKNTAGATDAQVAATEEWITAQGKALGVADDELRPALARLAGATGDVGKAQKLAALAMDISAGSGKSMEQVSTALMKAQNGQVAGLSRLGISTKNAEGKVISFEEAQRRLAKLHGGQAQASANTLQGKMDRLKLILGETGEEIGAKLIPVATKMADWFLNKGLPAIQKFGGWLGENIPPIVEKVKGVIASFTGEGSGKFSKFVEDVKAIFNDGVSIVRSIWDKFGSDIMTRAKEAIDATMQTLKGAFQVIRGIFKTVSSLLKGDWKGAWQGIKLILKGALNVLVGLVKNLWSTIKFTFSVAGKALKGIFVGIWDGIKTAARNGIGWLVDRVREIPGNLAALGTKFFNAGKDLVGKIVSGIKGAAGFASDFAGDIWEAVKGAINSGIGKLNSLLEFSIKVGPKSFSVNPPDIGYLARGTNNWRGGLAVVGEEGPELLNLPPGSRVTPHAQSMAAMRGMGGGVVNKFYITGALDPVAVGKQIEQILIKTQRATGRRFQVTTL